MAVDRIFVAGAGLMGSGIAQVAAQGAYRVVIHDVSISALDKGIAAIRQSLDRFVKKGALSAEQREGILSRIRTTVNLEEAADADLVIEAVFEDLDLKRKVFAQLDALCPPRVYLASNTSALPITRLAAATRRPEQVIGTHFFSPVPMMKLVEIVRGAATADETVAMAQEVVRRMSKESVVVQRDFGGFLLNRIALPYSRMAIIALTEGIASAEEIDKGMRLGFGMPMGPLELADLTGLDVLLNAMTAIYNDIGDEAFCPPPLLKRMVEAGYLGRKAGRGFYRYDSSGARLPPDKARLPQGS